MLLEEYVKHFEAWFTVARINLGKEQVLVLFI